MRYFPIFIDLAGKTVVVVGGGEEALRKVRLLLKTTANIHVIAPALHDELAAEARVHWLARTFEPRLLDGATLVYGANPALNGAVAEAARARGIPVNAVDAPEMSSFITPSIVDRDPLVVAIGTEGTAPILARGLRAKIDALLPAGLGRLAAKAGVLRQRIGAELSSVSRRRSFWQSFFFGPARDAFLAGDELGYVGAVESAIAASGPKRAGQVAFICTVHDDPELMTLKAQRYLLEADVIVYDADVPPGVLELARRDAVRVIADSNSAPALLIAEAASGRQAVRLGGGCDEISLVEAAGVAVVAVSSGVTVTAQQSSRPTAQIVPFPVREDIRDAILRAAS